ncbi:hypothetical protein TWF730_004675 [Orbilia blumenaviensis]|uniref:Cullin family profile domain-containing protein n=1 Tax=Orbilia blumenaviensis TaxID=1796055 RepID=A0AAV9TYJ0_9PEZI
MSDRSETSTTPESSNGDETASDERTSDDDGTASDRDYTTSDGEETTSGGEETTSDGEETTSDYNGPMGKIRRLIDTFMLKSGKVTLPIWMETMTEVHLLCEPRPQVKDGFLNWRRGSHLAGEELYRYLEEYLEDHLDEVLYSIEDNVGEDLLEVYLREWDSYIKTAEHLSRAFSYLNRHWIKREQDEGKKNIYTVFVLFIMQWRNCIVENIHEILVEIMLELIEGDRRGEEIKVDLIKDFITSLNTMAIDQYGDPDLEIYERFFKEPFLDATQIYYESSVAPFLDSVDCIGKLVVFLEEDKKRSARYLHEENPHREITTALDDICLETWVFVCEPLLHTEIQYIIRENHRELSRLYQLLSGINGGLEFLRDAFQLHICHTIPGATDGVLVSGDTIDPKHYFDTLISVYGKYYTIAETAFEGHKELVSCIHTPFRDFINSNKLGPGKGNGSQFAATLAKYSDLVLRKSKKDDHINEDDLKVKMSGITAIFACTQDKYAFQELYIRLLAKRLICGSSISDEVEASMHSKLEGVCKFENTKFQNMFRDLQVSRDLTMEFVTNISFAVKVLGVNSWELPAPDTTFILPQEIAQITSGFLSFYNGKHSGHSRKLTWLHSFSQGDLRAKYTDDGKTYNFRVSTYQMGILLLFNEAETYSYDNIAQLTLLHKGVLDPTLDILVKRRVLLFEEKSCIYSLNKLFRNPKFNVDLTFTPKPQRKVENENLEAVEKARGLIIQAAIVRTMKSHKKMKYSLLVDEVIRSLQSRFKPDIPAIKRNIDILLDREYLERGDGDQLTYLP